MDTETKGASNVDVEGTPAGRADASDVRDDGPRNDGGDRRIGESGGPDALGVGAPASGVGADGPTARPVSQTRIDRIVGAARAMLADANNMDVRRRYISATFNLDRTAEVIAGVCAERDMALKGLGVALAALQHIQGMEPVTHEITLATVMAQHAVDALKEIEALGATSCPNPCDECRGVVQESRCVSCGWEVERT